MEVGVFDEIAVDECDFANACPREEIGAWAAEGSASDDHGVAVCEPILGGLIPEWELELADISLVWRGFGHAILYALCYRVPMTQCSSENLFPAEGFGWKAPDPLPLEFESDRLILRAYTHEDPPELIRVIGESRDKLLPWLPWAKTAHMDFESSLAFVMERRMSHREPQSCKQIVLGMFLKDTGELIGGSGIHDIRPDTASCEAGYWCAASHRRKGYSEEACRRVISWAMATHAQGGMGLRRVRIYTSSGNEGSTALANKFGITKEVEQRDDYFVQGFGISNRCGWGVLADEWDCEKHCAINPITHA